MKAEDKKFMAELSAEMNTQDHCSQADPRYWVIMDSKWVLVADGCGEAYHVCFDCEEYELNDFADMLIENYEHDEKREDEIREAIGLCYDTTELHEAIEEFFAEDYSYLGDCKLFEVRKEYYVSYNTGIFLTKKYAEAYLKAMSHHFSADAYVFAMTALYNYEQERLTEIIKNTNWEEL